MLDTATVSSPPRIVFLDRATMGPSVILRAPNLPHIWVDYDRSSADQVVDRLRGATIAVTSGLSAGQRVVVAGAGFLGDGDLVTVGQRASAPAPAPARSQGH